MTRLFVLAATLGAALHAGAAPRPAVEPLPDFVALERSPAGEIWLLDGASGVLWLQKDDAPPTPRTSLVRAGVVLDWRGVGGIARLDSTWFVAGRRGKLERFGADGRFLGEAAPPAPIGAAVRSGGLLWLAPVSSPGPGRTFWVTRDGKSFLEVPVPPDPGDPIGTGLKGIVDSLAFLAPDGLEGLAFARVVGGPMAFRVSPDGERRAVPLAYRRTRARDSERSLRVSATDLTVYSTPARDLVGLKGGSLAVLRNIEEVRDGSGEVRESTGTVVDLYGPAGRHVSSAEFPEKVRFLLRVDERGAVVLCSGGRIRTRAFGSRIPGGIQ